MRAGITVIGMLLAGCSAYGPPPTQHQYILESASSTASTPGPAAGDGVALLVLRSSVASFYATRQIAFSRTVGTRDHYQFSSWTETPDAALDAMLLDRLRRTGAYRTVAPATSGVSGDWLLTTRLDEIFHDALSSPGIARVKISAELIDPERRTVIAREVFAAQAPVPSYDAAGAVAGLRAALASAVDEEAAWAAAQIERR